MQRPPILQGGYSDGHYPNEYDTRQIKMGIKVEMEHTKIPEVALQIAMDHLEEFPDYYDRLEKMEKDAKKYWSKAKKRDVKHKILEGKTLKQALTDMQKKKRSKNRSGSKKKKKSKSRSKKYKN